MHGNERASNCMNGRISGISGIDDTLHETLNRLTSLSPTIQVRLTSREDANLLLFLQENEENGVYLHDMGQMDDTERSHMIVDKDT